ncbi:MAG: alpha/beta hydrolase-fold protein [Bryobacteraceae bacterium]
MGKRWRILFLGAVAPLFGAGLPPEYSEREAPVRGAEPLKYLVYAPRQLAAGERYPLVVYLHGSCKECVTHERIARESGLRMWHGYDRNVQREPTFLFAPAGGTGGWTREPRREKIFELIDGLLEEFPIDRRRIYIMGFSMGGAGTWNYIQERPDFFAAANPQAIGGGVVNAEAVKNVPIWATIGVDDNADRIDQLTANVARIRTANGDPRGAATGVAGVNPRFNIFPATNHGGAQAKTQELPGFLDWFYSQVNDGNHAPNVRFIRPAPSPEPYQRTVGATVAATDPDGSVDRVEFFSGADLVAVDREAPYAHTFTGLAPGPRRLKARAVDAGGKSRTAEVTVLVAPVE